MSQGARDVGEHGRRGDLVAAEQSNAQAQAQVEAQLRDLDAHVAQLAAKRQAALQRLQQLQQQQTLAAQEQAVAAQFAAKRQAVLQFLEQLQQQQQVQAPAVQENNHFLAVEFLTEIGIDNLDLNKVLRIFPEFRRKRQRMEESVGDEKAQLDKSSSLEKPGSANVGPNAGALVEEETKANDVGDDGADSSDDEMRDVTFDASNPDHMALASALYQLQTTRHTAQLATSRNSPLSDDEIGAARIEDSATVANRVLERHKALAAQAGASGLTHAQVEDLGVLRTRMKNNPVYCLMVSQALTASEEVVLAAYDVVAAEVAASEVAGAEVAGAKVATPNGK